MNANLGNFDSHGSWLIYGTGQLASQALRVSRQSGLSVELLGRSGIRVSELAAEHDVVGHTVSLNEDLSSYTRGRAGVINLAGPFSSTALPLIEAALEARIHYIDASNELDTHLLAQNLGAHAADCGVALVPGAGMGTWHGELLIRALISESGANATSATLISLPSPSKIKSPGVSATHRKLQSSPGVILKSNSLITLTDEERAEALPSWCEFQAGVSLPTGDLLAITKSSGIANVKVLAAVNMPLEELRLILTDTLEPDDIDAKKGDRHPVFPPQAESLASESLSATRLLGEITAENGRRVRGRLISESGTSASAASTIACAIKLENNDLTGYLTAYQALGDDAQTAGPVPIIEVLEPIH